MFVKASGSRKPRSAEVNLGLTNLAVRANAMEIEYRHDGLVSIEIVLSIQSVSFGAFAQTPTMLVCYS